MNQMPRLSDFRVDPAIEAEQALLGAVLMNKEVLGQVAGIIGEEDFSEPLHQELWKAAGTLVASGMPATAVSLIPVVSNLQDMDGPAYLASLVAEATTIVNAVGYAQQIANTAKRKRLMQSALEIAEECQRWDAAPHQIAEQAVALFQSHAVRPADLTNVEAEIFGSATAGGIYTRFAALDDLIAPMLPGQLIVVGARKKMGKTPMMMRIADDLARQEIGVGFISLELTPAEMEQRYLCSLADVSLHTIQARNWNVAEGTRIEKAWTERKALPLQIRGAGRWTTARLRATATEMKRRHGIGCLIVDQLSWLDVAKSRDKFDRIGQAVGEVKALAQDLGIPIVLASQLNRGAEPESYMGPGSVRRPSSQHLYGADEIAQTADVVLLVHRPEKMLASIEPPRDAEVRGKALHPQWSVEMERWRGKAELIAVDRRSGPEGAREVAFNAPRLWFHPLNQRQDEQEHLPI
jgi:replicative DNA helicase